MNTTNNDQNWVLKVNYKNIYELNYVLILKVLINYYDMQFIVEPLRI